MSKHEEFFESYGSKRVLDPMWKRPDPSLENLYQAIKSRLIAELTVDGWSQCGRIGGELKDKESGE